MIIQTDIKATGDNGRESRIAVKSPEELLSIMEHEGIDQCSISVIWLGQEPITDRIVTAADVKAWIAQQTPPPTP